MATKHLIIGPSNGWLYANKIYSTAEQQKIIRSVEANALEIALFNNDVQRAENLLSRDQYKGLAYCSVHLDDYYPELEIFEQVESAAKILKKHRPDTVLIHPLEMPKIFLKELADYTSLAIENMDKNKTKGFDIKELEQKILRYRIGFVLDVQHAYEHDHSMKYAKDLFTAFRHYLKHLHLSGENTKTNHALLHQADNAKSILGFVGDLISEKNVPIILEGEYQNPEELKKEIEFIRKELGMKN